MMGIIRAADKPPAGNDERVAAMHDGGLGVIRSWGWRSSWGWDRSRDWRCGRVGVWNRHLIAGAVTERRG
jgi:hypothetical protein